MTVAELIKALQSLPPDLPVVFFNQCADDGVTVVSVESAEVRTHASYGGRCHAPSEMPAECVVL